MADQGDVRWADQQYQLHSHIVGESAERGNVKSALLLVAALLVGAGLASGAVLGVTRPWEAAAPTATAVPAPLIATVEPKAAFNQIDILKVTQQQVASLPFPQGAQWVRCTGARFRPANSMWVVECEFRAEKTDAEPLSTRTYTVSDQDGKLVK